MTSFEPLDYLSSGVEKSYRLIITRIGELLQYAHLRKKIFDLLQNRRLEVLNAVPPQAAARLYEAGLIDKPVVFQDYITGLNRLNYDGIFFTAPGSRMGDHHSYPGGLVYHTAADIELALGMAEVYERIYRISVNREILIIALTLHDIAKKNVFAWDEQGRYPEEIKIAGTEGHHIFSIAEIIRCGFPFPIVKALAFCHNRATPPENGLNRYLEAAYIIAGLEITPVESDQITLEDWICLYADSDWMISGWAMRQSLIGLNCDSAAPATGIYQYLSNGSEFQIFKK